MTDTEQFVWQRVRYRQLDGFKFRRQFPIGAYVVDFVCLERRLILELYGGQHAERRAEDETRTRWLEDQGFKVIRFWNFEVFQDWETVERVIWESLQRATPPP